MGCVVGHVRVPVIDHIMDHEHVPVMNHVRVPVTDRVMCVCDQSVPWLDPA